MSDKHIATFNGNYSLSAYYGTVKDRESEEPQLKDDVLARIRTIFIEQAEQTLGNHSSDIEKIESVLDAVIATDAAREIFKDNVLAEEQKNDDFFREPPTKAPELWRNRDKSKDETPVSFIKRVYNEWVGKGLTTADLKDLDKPLYTAFYNRPKDPENIEEIDLPTLTQQTRKWVERVGKDTPPSELPYIIGEPAAKRLLNSRQWRSRNSKDSLEK